MGPRPKRLADIDPLPDIPHDAAQAGLDALILAMIAGPPLARDPHAAAKTATFDRLVFGKVPVLCAGPTGVHRIARPGELGRLVALGGVDEWR